MTGNTGSSQTITINKVTERNYSTVEDCVAVEEPLEIQLISSTAGGSAAKTLSITMRTPGADEELALGFLLTEGIIRDAGQVVSVQHTGPVTDDGLRNTIRVELRDDVDITMEKLERHFYTTSSCGVCGKTSLDALYVSGQTSLARHKTVFCREVLTALPDRVRLQQPLFATTGGLHAASVFTADGEIVIVKEDVGRHNATDKVIGSLLTGGRLPGNTYGLLVSGRASFELMQKALVAGIPLLAAVGAPSSLAVATARKFDMTLIGFLRNGTFNIYAGKKRIG